ncbi:hypothetical protein QFZ36_000332 [Pseudarthrobacter siccitolerans]|uniref:Uncharacterized protein n=1 Tax=Pseudarthrobacter siccitolerans TaxID=861266 RepID=A0ABU0PHL6_9MICC|nr:hypothetical protein [Pseudarthrobacter siccitolerans]
MSDTMDPTATDVDQQELAQQLLAQARASTSSGLTVC